MISQEDAFVCADLFAGFCANVFGELNVEGWAISSQSF